MAVDYLNETRQELFEIFVGEDGFLYHPDGELVDTSDSFHVNELGIRSPSKAIYVMDGKGRILLSKYSEVGKFHHSSLVGGQPTAVAGEAEIFEGRRGSFNNYSGHYRHDAKCVEYIRQELEARGADLTGFVFHGVSW